MNQSSLDQIVQWKPFSVVGSGGRALWFGFVCALILASGCGDSQDAKHATDNGMRAQSPSAGEPRANTARAHPLNVLLITMDTTRADALGVYGQPLPVTPNIDRLAKDGVVFKNAMSAAPLTVPSHASIMTAVYPFVHGARSNDEYVLSKENITLAEILKKNGYRTGAEIGGIVLNRRTGMDQGFLSYRDMDSPGIQKVHVSLPNDGKPTEVVLDERYASDITQGGVKFLHSVHDAPFFLWLHYFSPHAPYIPPEEMAKPFPGRPYLGEVHYVDYAIGEMVTALEKLGLLQNTLIVITADHGESMGEHQENGHSFLVYDTTVHVPLIFYLPGQLPEIDSFEPVVRTIDIAPTILDVLHLPPMENVEGTSLVPFLREPSTDPGFASYGESSQVRLYFGGSVIRYVRIGAWKYIHKLKPELYDLQEDPSETHNLSDAQPERLAEFRKTLREIIASSPTPLKSARVSLSPLERRQLEKLGYMTTYSKPQAEDGVESIEVTAPDPNSVLSDVDLFFRALDASQAKRYDEAIPIYKDLTARYPDGQRFIQAYLTALLVTKQYESARPLIHEILRRGSALDEFWPNFIEGLAKTIRARDDKGLTLLQELLAYDVCNIGTTSKLSKAYRLRGRYLDERNLLEDGLARCKPSLERVNNLAFLLATSPDASVRDGIRAVKLALKGAKMTNFSEPAVLDTLAAAYAEAGNFEQAVATSQNALALLEKRHAPFEQQAGYREHLELFSGGEPLRAN